MADSKGSQWEIDIAGDPITFDAAIDEEKLTPDVVDKVRDAIAHATITTLESHAVIAKGSTRFHTVKGGHPKKFGTIKPR